MLQLCEFAPYGLLGLLQGGVFGGASYDVEQSLIDTSIYVGIYVREEALVVYEVASEAARLSCR